MDKQIAKLPRHVGIIMDGNGRWAEQHGLPRARGHERGARTVRLITEECARLGIEWVTLYAFSSENWRRPQKEINHLMRLLRQFLIKEREALMRNNLQLRAVGQIERLPQPAREALIETINLTRNNSRMVLCLALSYGGRQELVDAAKRISLDVAKGVRTAESISESLFATYMYDPEMPEVDLLVRTGGEMRLSNFLLWQCAYAELYITPTLWPAFNEQELKRALTEFSKRERRFGGTRPG